MSDDPPDVNDKPDNSDSTNPEKLDDDNIVDEPKAEEVKEDQKSSEPKKPGELDKKEKNTDDDLLYVENNSQTGEIDPSLYTSHQEYTQTNPIICEYEKELFEYEKDIKNVYEEYSQLNDENDPSGDFRRELEYQIEDLQNNIEETKLNIKNPERVWELDRKIFNFFGQVLGGFFELSTGLTGGPGVLDETYGKAGEVTGMWINKNEKLIYKQLEKFAESMPYNEDIKKNLFCLEIDGK